MNLLLSVVLPMGRYRALTFSVVLIGLLLHSHNVITQDSSPSPGREQTPKRDTERQNPAPPIPRASRQDVPFTQPHANEPNAHPYDWYEWVKPQTLTAIALSISALWAASIGLGILRAMTVQVKLTKQAVRDAEAERKNALVARLSGNMAAQSFPVASVAFVSVDNLRVEEMNNGGDLTLSVAYRIFNASPNPLTVLQVSTEYDIAGQHSEGIERKVDETFAPMKGVHFAVHVGPLTQDQRESYNVDMLLVNLVITVTFIDAFQQTTIQELRRLVVCSPFPERCQSRLWILDGQASG